MALRGHTPVRTCIACREKRAKRTLVRIAVDRENQTPFVDSKQRAPGRGVYVCPECLLRLGYDKKMQRAFRHRAKGLWDKMPLAVLDCPSGQEKDLKIGET
ncbi:MAG: DUF448 domain-containing protein [Deltaproteobacteria bacterium]|nr:DUF448 domain-containing protein [Deltaproteobacteria bacterium]